jgi:hypothetical protein
MVYKIDFAAGAFPSTPSDQSETKAAHNEN